MRRSSRFGMAAWLVLAAVLLLAAGKDDLLRLALLPAAHADDSAPATVAMAQSDSLGAYLTDANGMTLYVFGLDQPDTSVCAGNCAASWPPFLTGGDPVAPANLPGTLGTLTRADGGTQVTYNHQPLYSFAGDAQPGDTNGQGIGGVWFVASISASPADSATATPAPAPTTSARATTQPAPAAPTSTPYRPSTGYTY